MSIVLKVVRCARQCSWMSHQTSIVVYIEFAWNYTGFNSNYYYFIRNKQLWKSPNYANKFQNYSSVGYSWIPVWCIGSLAAADRLKDRDNAAGIGDNYTEIGDDPAGIVDIAVKVTPS